LNAAPGSVKHLALVVIHPDAVDPHRSSPASAPYDLYVPPNLDDRADTEIQQNLRDAIVNARVRLQTLVGVASVFGALWFTAKVFRIGLLMYGKPPSFATLIRWARAA
jgi:hypothetical protein